MRKSGLVKDKHLWAAYITRPVRAPCVDSLWLPCVLLHLMKSKCWLWKLMSQGMFKLQIAKDMVICWQTEWQWVRVMYNIISPPDASHSKHSFAEQHGSLRWSDIDPLTVMEDLSYDLELNLKNLTRPDVIHCDGRLILWFSALFGRFDEAVQPDVTEDLSYDLRLRVSNVYQIRVIHPIKNKTIFEVLGN